MAGISNNPNSPRQRMINLMYLVFIAMMALNVSSEVLDGYQQQYQQPYGYQQQQQAPYTNNPMK